MSRPKATALGTWATGNYGAGPAWGGLSKRLAPSGTELVPLTGAGARVQNYLLGDLYDGVNASVLMSGQGPVLDFQLGLKGTNTNALKHGFFSAKDQAWFAVGTGASDACEVTLDHGRNWTNLAGSLGAALTCLGVAASPAGDVAIVTASRTVYKGVRTAYGTWTWTNHANMISAIPAGTASLDFDPVTSRWIVAYRNGAAGKVDYTTVPSTAWTAGTLPAAWSTYVGTNDPELGVGGGRIVAVYLDASVPRLNLMYSTDGGANWTNVQKTLAMSAADAAAGGMVSKPCYDAGNGDWIVSVSSSNRKTEFYSSSDGGVTWTLVKNLSASDWYAGDLANLGGLFVSMNDDGRIAYSIDRGVSWKFAGYLKGTAVARRWIRSGGGGFMTWNASADKSSWASPRFGDPGLAL